MIVHECMQMKKAERLKLSRLGLILCISFYGCYNYELNQTLFLFKEKTVVTLTIHQLQLCHEIQFLTEGFFRLQFLSPSASVSAVYAVFPGFRISCKSKPG